MSCIAVLLSDSDALKGARHIQHPGCGPLFVFFTYLADAVNILQRRQTLKTGKMLSLEPEVRPCATADLASSIGPKTSTMLHLMLISVFCPSFSPFVV